MSKKLTYEFVKEQIEKVKGYKLLSKEYVNNKTKMQVKCPKGHVYEVHWNNFKSGKRCKKCLNERNRHSYDYVKESIEKVKGYKLLSKTYIDCDTKMDVQCPEGHVYKAKFRHFDFMKQRCPVCNNINKSNRQRLPYNYVKNQIEKVKGYKLLSKEYVRNNLPLDMLCPEGHKYKQSYSSFQQGHRCSTCFEKYTISKGEKEVLKYVKNFIHSDLIIPNDRTQIVNSLTGHYLELDIYIPSLNKAIEYNGTYWHSLPNKIIKDQEKVKQCKEKGIDLLIIKEEHWQNDKESYKSIIKEWIS